ncbi:MAG: porin [Bacteroidota bacterium]|jgi:porin|nr:porin [Bacteroidota bacterium]MDN5305501.1 porin [Bacteroidota bacterium]
MRENLIFLWLVIAVSLQADNDSTKQASPFLFTASYVGENVFNLSGGIKTGYNYLGFANLNLTFDTEKAGLWIHGEFFINAANTHGKTPSENMFGDLQIASNIEAGNHTYLQELWYRHHLEKVELTVGLQDMNAEFVNTENGGLFLNSSFGIPPTFSLNLHAPIFPLTSLGITAKWQISDRFIWLNGVYDGTPTDFGKNPYNINWQFKKGDGILGVSELQYLSQNKQWPGTYKLGIFAHNHVIERTFSNLPDSLDTNTWGLYGIIDQQIWQLNNKKINGFLQIGYSPSEVSANDFYLGAGMNFTGFLCKTHDDELGIAIAHAHLAHANESETAIELTWHKPLLRYFYLQPDIQYIIHPSGKSSGLKDVLAAFLRFGFEF